MPRGFLSLAIMSLAEPAFASGVRASNIAPIMIAPVLSAGLLALIVGAFGSNDSKGGAGWLIGAAVFVQTVVLSRLLAGFGYIAAVMPQILVGIVLLASRKQERQS
jgi:hypothetical protein